MQIQIDKDSTYELSTTNKNIPVLMVGHKDITLCTCMSPEYPARGIVIHDAQSGIKLIREICYIINTLNPEYNFEIYLDNKVI